MMTYEKNTPSSQVIAHMVEVTFPEGENEGFRKVRETLERMGIPSVKEKTLCQSVHILHKQGQYYICHFKELFALDGRRAELSGDDIARRNLAVRYLKDWGMIQPITDNWQSLIGHPSIMKVIKHSERENWTLTNKYFVGGDKVKHQDV